MAIRIIDGIPGSGKSYYAVNHLYKTYFYEKPDHKDFILYSNIDSLTLDHVDLRLSIKDAGGVADFFGIVHQKELYEKFGKIIYVIDEAQTYFRKSEAKKLSDVFSYFEYHRHWGHDIYLITQNAKKLPLDISTLPEYVVHSCPRVRSLLGEFKYRWISEGEVIKRETLKPDKKIFALYSSQDSEETEKISNPVVKIVALMLVVAVALSVGGWTYFKKVMSPDSVPAVPVDVSSVAGSPENSFKVEKMNMEIVSDLVQTRLNVIIQYSGRFKQFFYIYNGSIVPAEVFPYKVKKIGTGFYADLPRTVASPTPE